MKTNGKEKRVEKETITKKKKKKKKKEEEEEEKGKKYERKMEKEIERVLFIPKGMSGQQSRIKPAESVS